MRILFIFIFILVAIIMAFVRDPKNDSIFYVSLNHAIQEGQYDGVVPVNRLRELGDFGLGSEERLKGELVVVDGEYYSIPSDGRAHLMKGQERIAFASIKIFQPDRTMHLDGVSGMRALEAYLNTVLDQNGFAAVRIRGKFPSIRFRSFVEQAKPYKPLDEVKEITFDKKDLEGTLVGFFTPRSAEVLNSPNYHFHFIDNSRQTGGHVLDCEILSATVEVDYARELHIVLPQKESVEHVDLNKPLPSKKG